MTPLRQAVWGCALVFTAATASPASAAWNNVFQVTCFNCRSSTSAYYAPAAPVAACGPACGSCGSACAPACPQQTCTTRYVQRCYYQPVVTYRTSYYYQPVTTYRTSYYYEPVTSYRYSCYYDPCSCSYQQVAQPVTSYRLRSQCSPVTSYLQRTCQTPVTSYQQSFYYEPVTSCSMAPACAPAPACQQPSCGAAPAITEQRTPPPANQPPGVQDSRDLPPTSNENMKRSIPSNPPPSGSDGAYRQPQLNAPVPTTTPTPTRSGVRLDRIVALPGHNLEGRVVSNSRQPQAGASLLFVHAERNGTRQAATADESGHFRVSLASGSWLVYTHNVEGRPVFSQKVDVNERDATHVTLVSR